MASSGRIQPVRFTWEASMVTIPDSLAGHTFGVDIDDDDVVVDAYVVVRVQNMETGKTAVVTATTDHTDVVVSRGLLACATEISAQTEWADRDDD